MTEEHKMANTLSDLSNEIAVISQAAEASVVAVQAGAHRWSSGVIWREGVVVTAERGVRRDENIQVKLSGGRTLKAELAGRDPGSDLAVLKVAGLDAPRAALPPATGTPRVGSLVLVLGRSPNSGLNASLGIVSAASPAWRTWRGGRLDEYLRLDARVFPGSAGGAVVDVERRLLGVATLALSRIAALAIPPSTVDRVAGRLLAEGHIPRGYLGIGLQPVPISEASRTKLSLGNRSGLMAIQVEPESPAEQAGMLPGDILVALDDQAVEQLDDLMAFLDPESVGKSVRARLIRAGTLTELPLVVGGRPRRAA
jgi:S1-C subfamily serine protease